MNRIEAKSERRRERLADARRGRLRLRPAVLALEGRALLSTLTVINTSDSGPGSLRAAISQADQDGGGDTIVFSSMFDTPQTITLTGGQLELTGTEAGTTITGPGANLLTVSGNNASRVFLVDANASAKIAGLTVTGGNAQNDDGGGVEVNNDASLTLTDCTISGNAVSDRTGVGGGLVCLNGGSLAMTDCTVSSNNAGAGGGLSSSGTATLTDCTVSGNSSSDNGGGLYIHGASATLILTDCTVSGNSASDNGGGLYNVGGSATLASTIVAGNVGGDNVSGPGFYTKRGNNIIGGNPLLAVLGDYGGPTFTMPPLPGSPAIGRGTTTGAPSTDERGQPRTGRIDIGAFQTQPAIIVNTTSGGVGSDPGELNLRQAVNLANALATADTITFSSLFDTSQTIALSGGELLVTNQAMTTITGPGADLLTISGNEASRVFEIRRGSAELSGLTITGGSAESGAGLYNNNGMLTLANCTISGNTIPSTSDSRGGGGLYNYGGTSTLTDCTISENTSYGRGGGLLQGEGWLILSGCTVSGNRASMDGGGLGGSVNGGGMSLTNCTVTGNTAGTYGGGLDSPDLDSSLVLDNCTISRNQCGISGGGIFSIGIRNVTWLTNTIVAGNAAAGDANDAQFSYGYSGSNNLVGGDPLLAPLGDYGGSTLTMALLPGSPAIDAGATTGAPTTDQRGLSRAGDVDIGAFQSQGFVLKLVAGSTPQSAAVGTEFVNPLAATVTATNPVEPVDGGFISFAALATGASASLSAATATVVNGQVSVTATADTIAGSYTVTASVAGVTAPASFALTNTAASRKLVAQPVAAVAGRAFINVVVATFTDSDPNASPSDFVAAIAWGDGITTSSTTVIADGQGRFHVLGTHTYVDAGTYTFSVQVTDNRGASATATSTAAVTADANTEAPSPVLTTPRDGVEQFDDLTSLRQAVAYADSHPGPDTITFDPDPSGKKRRTIKLIGGPLVLTNPATTTIIGPGARRLVIQGDGKGPVFDIDGGSLSLDGVTISGGRAVRGGGIRNKGGRLLLTDVVIRGNRARVGGGLYNDGMAVLNDVVIRGNQARIGSGLFNTRRATFTWSRSPAGGRR
jgi:fibronectin-binding autotransporter adhesin